MKYVIYLRVSTTGQDLTPQLEKCLENIRRDHRGDLEYLVFSDKKTAKNDLKHRPGMRDTLSCLRRGDVLVSTKIDRIARNGAAAYEIQDRLIDKGVKLRLTDQPHMHDPLIFAMMVGLSIKELEMISTRTKDKLLSKKQRGERTGTVPYGFKLDPDKKVLVKGLDGKKVEKLGMLVEEPYEQKVVAEMLSLFDSGISLRRLTKILAEKGFVNRKGQAFQYTSVRGILLRLGRTKFQERPQEESEFETIRLVE